MRLRHLDLRGRVVGNALAGHRGHAWAGSLDVIVEGRLGETERHRTLIDREHRECRKLVERRRVGRTARRIPAAFGQRDGKRSAIGDKTILDRHVRAAGTTQAGGVPGVEDFVVGARNRMHLGNRRAVTVLGKRRGDEPVRTVNAARKRPAAAQPPAAVNLAGFATTGNEHACDHRIRRAVPDFVLTFGRKVAKQNIVRAILGQAPASRAAGLRDRFDDVDHAREMRLRAAVTRGLHDSLNPRIPHGLHHDLGEPAGLLRLGGMLADQVDQRLGLGKQARARWPVGGECWYVHNPQLSVPRTRPLAGDDQAAATRWAPISSLCFLR